MTMITPSYLGETIEYSSLHACRSTLEDPTLMDVVRIEFARHHDGRTAPRVLVDNRQHAKPPAVLSAVLHEVARTHVVGPQASIVLRPFCACGTHFFKRLNLPAKRSRKYRKLGAQP